MCRASRTGLDLGLGRVDGLGAGRHGDDAVQAGLDARQVVLHRGQRGDDDVVLIGEAGGALDLQHTVDQVVLAVELHGLADTRGAVATEEVLGDGRAEDGHRRVGGVVAVGEVRTDREGVVVDAEVARAGPDEARHRVRHAGVPGGHRGRVEHGSDGPDIGRVGLRGQRVGVVEGQVGGVDARARGRARSGGATEAAPTAETAATGEAARPAVPARRPAHRQRVRAEGGDALLHGGAGAGPDGEQDDHGGDADQDPQRRQQGAQLVRPDTAQGEAHGTEDVHAGTPTAR